MRLFKQTLSLLLTIAALAVAQSAWAASTWTITPSTSGTYTTFTISRSGDTSKSETVLYRFVGLSAYAGQHFKVSQINGGAIATSQQIALLSGSFTFAATETSKTVTIEEITASNDAYIFQNGTSRSYKLEVTDQGGFLLKDYTRSFDTGTSVPGSGLFNERTITIYTSEVQYSDAGYDQTNNPHYIESSAYYGLTNIAPKAYYTLIGAELRSTLSFDAKEKNNGYQYVQILINNITDSDNRSTPKCDDGDPGNMNISLYMAGFDHDPGDKNTNYAAYTFPVLSQPNNCSALANAWSNGVDNILYTQKFNTNCRATDGRLILPLDFEKLVVRFNASGGGTDHDEWLAKNVKAHIQAVDATAPTVLSNSINVAPGKHAKSNTIYVSVAFKEIVTSSNAKLNTNWGTLSYNTGSGSNVLTFKGTIGNSATGSLNITGYSGTITDLAGNNFTGTITGSNLCALDANYNYPITYELNGGSVATANPTTYTYETATFTLNNPTRTGYTFDGWTGSNGTTASTDIQIAQYSHGDKSYTANWIAHTYTVRFHSNYDTDVTSDQAFTYDTAQNLTADVFSRTGYTFAEWTTNADGSGTTYTNGQELLNLTTEDGAVIDLYAQWTAHTYTVHFDANNGSGTMTDQPFTYDAAQNLTTNTFSAATGYVFNGWNTQANGTGTSYTDGQSVSNLTPDDGATFTLYANWTDVWGMAGGADGTQQHPYIITTAGFDLLAKYVNGTDGYTANNFNNKYFKLGADITVSTMVGTNQTRSFQGTFDGDNKTITLALTATSEDCAPFKYLYNATIKNLNIAGTISTSNKFAASIAAHTYGTTNIEHCTSTVEITSTVSTANSDGTHGGFVGVNDNGTLSFSNCVFAGKLLGANATCNGGFVGWNEKTTVNYTDCLFAPAEITMGEANSATFNRNGKNSFTRTFFLTPFGEAQGTHATTTVPANGVYKNFTAVDGNNYYAICDITVDDLYAYTGSVVTVTPIVKFDNTTLTEGTDYTVTIKDSNNNTIAPEDLIETGNYTLIVAGTGSYTGTQTFAFSISTSANLNGYDFGLGTDSEGIYYKIETTDDLNRLAAYVNNGNEAYYQRFMLTADIAYTPTTVWNDATSTENNYTAIGNSDHAFCGTFDGQGHTVSGIRIYKPNEAFQGPFGRVYGAAIVKNVILNDARITGYWNVGGISGQMNGDATMGYPTIQNCLVLNSSITANLRGGAVIGFKSHGAINNNYYHNCSLTQDGTTETTDIGIENNDSNGARNVHALTLPDGVNVSAATESVTYNNVTYYASNSTVTLAGTEPTGHHLVYSATAGTIDGAVLTMPATDTEVTASLVPNTYTVAFNKNLDNATGTMSDQTFTYDVAQNLTANAFTCTGYIFNGWSTTPSGSVEYTDGQSVSNLTPDDGATITLYANWTDVWGIADGADGTQQHPYTITSTAGLDLLATEVNNGNRYNGKHFVLDDDITYTHGNSDTENNFTAIGCSNTIYFAGIFDGQNHTISGIRIYKPDTNNQGLFGVANGVTIKNIVLSDAHITGYRHVGGIAGLSVSSSATLQNFVLDTEITSTIYGGAIAGDNFSSTLTANYYRNCSLTLNGTTKTTDIGLNNADCNGARSAHTLTLPANVNVSAATESVTYNNVTYYASTSTVTLSPAIGYILTDVTVNGTAATDNGDGTWTFTMPAADATVSATLSEDPNTPVAILNDGSTSYYLEATYTTAEAALRAALDDAANASGSTVTLFRDVTLATDNIECMSGTYTLDLNGHSITGSDGVLVLRGANITLIDGSSAKTGSITDTGSSEAIVMIEGTLNCTGCTISSNISTGTGVEYLGGTLTLTDCTITGNIALSKETNSSNITLTNCTITGTSYGILRRDGVFLSLTDCTITGNVGIAYMDPPSSGSYGSQSFIGNNTIKDCTYAGILIDVNVKFKNLPHFGTGSDANGCDIASASGIIDFQTPDQSAYYYVPATPITVKAVGWDNYAKAYVDREVGAGAGSYTFAINCNHIKYPNTSTTIPIEEVFVSLNSDYIVRTPIYHTSSYNYSSTNSSPAQLTKPVVLNDNANNNASTIENFNDEDCAVTLQGRTLWKDGYWNTLCVPFKIDAISKTPLAGAEIRKLESASLENGTLTLNFSNPVTALVAGTPYIIKWTRANDYVDDDAHNLVNPLFSSVCVYDNTDDFTSTDGTVQFKGTYAPINFTDTDQSILFMGADNTLYYPANGAYINAFRAYFKLTDPNSQVRSFVLNFGSTDDDEDPTAIAEMVNGQWSMVNDVWFDLNGRRLANRPTRPGIYINNGKKIIIK